MKQSPSSAAEERKQGNVAENAATYFKEIEQTEYDYDYSTYQYEDVADVGKSWSFVACHFEITHCWYVSSMYYLIILNIVFAERLFSLRYWLKSPLFGPEKVAFLFVFLFNDSSNRFIKNQY